MLKSFTKIFTLSLALLSPNIYAQTNYPIQMVASNAVIQGLDQAISETRERTPLTVLFPRHIPNPDGTLYASYSSYNLNPNYKNFWQISADATAECKGMRVCNVGVVTAEKGRAIESTYDILPELKKLPKQRVMLQDGTNAYYTPTHTEASRVYSTIEWQKSGVTYTMRWKVNAPEDVTQQVIVDMANSVV